MGWGECGRGGGRGMGGYWDRSAHLKRGAAGTAVFVFLLVSGVHVFAPGRVPWLRDPAPCRPSQRAGASAEPVIKQFFTRRTGACGKWMLPVVRGAARRYVHVYTLSLWDRER